MLPNTLKADFSEYHSTISDLFPTLSPKLMFEKYKLSDEQVNFFNENGYLANVRILDNDQQIDQLLAELEQIMDPTHPKHKLFYEFHSNESSLSFARTLANHSGIS
jgi:hypothetical protein